MKYFFHPSAKIELNKAIDYYEKCKTGLGSEFSKEIYLTIQRIILFPEAWTKIGKDTRRCLTNRFPYGVLYHILEDKIMIVAVMQLNKKPGYWKNRII